MTEKEYKMWQDDLDMIEMLRKKNEKSEAIINKAIDILYCWGEVLDAKFQKQMLETLKGEIC